MVDPPRSGEPEPPQPAPPIPPAGTVPGPDAAQLPETLPAPRRLLPWIVGGAVALVAVVVVIVLLTRGDGGDRTLQGDGYSFDYPREWGPLSGAEFQASGGQSLSQEVVGIDQSNFAVIGTYRIQVAVTEDNVDDFRADVETTIGQLVDQAGGEVLSGPSPVTMAGLPGYRFQITAQDPDGNDVESRLVLVFRGTTEYFLNCQHSPGGEAEIEAGCDQIMETFEVSSA